MEVAGCRDFQAWGDKWVDWLLESQDGVEGKVLKTNSCNPRNPCSLLSAGTHSAGRSGVMASFVPQPLNEVFGRYDAASPKRPQVQQKADRAAGPMPCDHTCHPLLSEGKHPHLLPV